MAESKQNTRDNHSIEDRRQAKSGSRRSKNPIVQSTQSNEGETMQTATNEVQSVETQQSVNTEAQTMNNTETQTQEPQKQMTAFEAMLKARLEFEEKKTAAILQVRKLCDDWQIDLRKDVYPESIKPRKPYAKRIKVDASASPANSPASLQTSAGQATPLSDTVKDAEPAML